MTPEDLRTMAATAADLWAADQEAIATLQAAVDDRDAEIRRLTDELAASRATTAPKAAIGMACPRADWSLRLGQTGPVYARRLFVTSLTVPTWLPATLVDEHEEGRLPVVSFKVPNDDWRGAANGVYDAALRNIATVLATVPGPVYVCVHHEPSGNGTPADFAAMQLHVLPILAAGANVHAGVIVNGYWWSNETQRLTDVEIAAWLPANLLRLCEFVAADCYHGGTATDPKEGPAPKIRNFAAWASRVGVDRLGIGEYNGITADAITEAGVAILADARFVFACIFNSERNSRDGVSWPLEGE